jgi:hypothetical protein
MQNNKEQQKKKTLAEKKYDYTIRKLELPRYAETKKKKFLIIQIDALSCEVLKEGMDKGYCKFLRKLIKEKGYKISPYNPGIPSTTPSVQASILFGDNSSIPGFRFVDKKKKKQWSCGNPYDVNALERRLFSKHEGILEGGSSYCNHWTGGAPRAILTMSAMTKKKRMHRIKESTLWALLLLNPVSLLRVGHYTYSEFILELFESVFYKARAIFRGEHAHFGIVFPLRRVFMGAIFQELVTQGVILDIKRNVPKIYINFSGYDDLTHKRGAKTRSAFMALRGIDRRIKRICKKAGEDYEVFILSDHGQTDSVPFAKIEGMEIDEYIRIATQVDAQAFESMYEGKLSLARAAFNNARDGIDALSAPLRWVSNWFIRLYLKKVKNDRTDFKWGDKEKIFVETSSCLAHVYFNISTDTLNLSAIKKKYPDLIFNLLKSKGIGMIVAREGDEIHVLNRDGSAVSGQSVKKTGKDFLSVYGNEELLARQLKNLASMKNSGDLMIFGNYDGKKTVSFVEHYGSHGGVGGDMCEAFLMSKKKHDISDSLNAKVIYDILKGEMRE